SEGEIFEVEKILDEKKPHSKGAQRQYLVKWLGYNEESWVPECDINCPDLVEEFHRLHGTTKRSHRKRAPETTTRNSSKRNASADIENDRRARAARRSLKLSSATDLAWIALLSQAEHNVSFVNDVDAAGPPPEFTWTESIVYPPDISPPSPDVNIPCSCESTCGRGCRCVEEHFDGSRDDLSPYDAQGRVRFGPRRRLIVECNPACPCDDTCQLKVVQKGRKVNVQIFRCADGKGWGCRADEPIAKGTFVSRYTGNLIPSTNAPSTPSSYLFDLDFCKDDALSDAPFAIDGSTHGNVSRFFNHSCEPNLAPYAVLVDSPYEEQHAIAFFAVRNIEVGEELTFDYGGGGKDEGGEREGGGTMCLCGARRCKGYLPGGFQAAP
ncbi:hypothetical protein HKX48_002812, partial [Thoreauomyces humboldtii]